MTATLIQQSLDLAQQHRQAGRLHEAEALCQQVLAEQPDQADALHLLGIVAFQSGRSDDAMAFIRRSIALNPHRSHFHCNLGLVLASKGRLDEAIATYRHALVLSPSDAETHNNLGIALRAQGKLDQSIAAYRQALALRPESPETLNNLGNSLGAKGQWEQAVSAYRQALMLRRGYAEAHNNLGYALQAMGRVDDAIAEYRQALALSVNSPIALCNLGNALMLKHRLEEAIAAYRQAIALQPDFVEAHSELGNALRYTEHLDEALAECRQAVALQPSDPPARVNLGNVLHARGDAQGATDAYRHALALRPDYPAALANLANVYHLNADFPAALAGYRRAIELQADFASAHWNLGLVLLLLGDFAQGWPEYQWRRKIGEFLAGTSAFPQPIWDGSDLHGRRILLHFEQAFGDTIHFVRYVPAVAQRGGRVVLLAQPQMHRLLQGMPGVEQCLTPHQPLPPFDVHCPLPSLPLTLGLLRPQDLPWRGPYLKTDPALQEKFSDLLDAAAADFKIGLVWAGRSYPPDRSVPLSALAPLARPGVRFYSLQIGEGAEQARQPPPPMQLIDPTDRIEDFADTAALMQKLDLIVSIDTAAAQLAGALGKPAWVLLKHVPDWRWLLGRSDSPWYPTARLFRQPKPGDWGHPIAQMADALATLLAGRGSSAS